MRCPICQSVSRVLDSRPAEATRRSSAAAAANAAASGSRPGARRPGSNRTRARGGRVRARAGPHPRQGGDQHDRPVSRAEGSWPRRARGRARTQITGRPAAASGPRRLGRRARGGPATAEQTAAPTGPPQKRRANTRPRPCMTASCGRASPRRAKADERDRPDRRARGRPARQPRGQAGRGPGPQAAASALCATPAPRPTRSTLEALDVEAGVLAGVATKAVTGPHPQGARRGGRGGRTGRRPRGEGGGEGGRASRRRAPEFVQRNLDELLGAVA